MKITVHRGLEQIGGCITEISTDTSRIFIDFGQNLPGCVEPTTSEEDAAMVARILAQNKKEHEAVFYTHGHEDHVGLAEYIPEDVPQYMSEGAKGLLEIKYDVIRQAADLKAHELLARECDPQERSDAFRHREEAENKCRLVDRMRVWKHKPSDVVGESISIGNIWVTPFSNCHSIYDSYMFLIETDGKRIWHTGDYREHGYRGKDLFPTLEEYATDIDMLITEGTMLKSEGRCIHERRVSDEMQRKMQAFKYVFILASATDIERLAAIKEACREASKPLYICSLFIRKTMEYFTERESALSEGLFSFAPLFYKDYKLKKIKRTGMAMIVGTSQMERVRGLLDRLPQPETLLIYSSWDGYYKEPEQVKVNPKYKEFREMFHNVVDIHTSGHADRPTIEAVIKTVNPKKIICIHKDADAEL